MKHDHPFAVFESEIDIYNVVFGAALGGYIGIVLATENLPISQIWLLALLLAGMGQFLLTVREIGKSVSGKPYFGLKFPWNTSIALTIAAAIQLIAFMIPVAAERFSIIFRVWVLALAISVLMSYIKFRRTND